MRFLWILIVPLRESIPSNINQNGTEGTERQENSHIYCKKKVQSLCVCHVKWTKMKKLKLKSDEDTGAAESRFYKKEMASYNEPDEEEAQIIDELTKNEEPEDTKEQDEEEEEEETTELESDKKNISGIIKNYQFDSKLGTFEILIQVLSGSKKILMLNLVDCIVSNFVLKEVQKISKCIVAKKERNKR